MTYTTILNSNLEDRILINGTSSLNNIELITLLIGQCKSVKSSVLVAEDLLKLTGGDLYALGKLLPEGYEQVHGVGKQISLVLSVAMELGRRRTLNTLVKSGVIVSSRDVFNRFSDRLSDLQHEEFWILLLKRSNHVLAEIKISSGGLSGTVADPKLIFGRALALRASAIVLVHNHPSGNCKPSVSDRTLTRNLCKAGGFLDLPVVDHIIIADKDFVSFADEGFL
jgi:DNA repair protein RadC